MSSAAMTSRLGRSLVVSLLSLAVALEAAGNDDIRQQLGQALGGLIADNVLEDTDGEIELGRQITGRLLGAVPIHGDPAFNDYVNRIGRHIASHSRRPDLPWTFGVVDTDTISAYAMPGGYVVITAGLAELLEYEDELAGVLAHEIAHVQRRDQYNVIRKQEFMGIGTSVAQARVTRNVQNEHVRGVADTLLGSGASVLLLSLDKDAEFRSDAAGTRLASSSGYNPLGLYSALQKINEASSVGTTVELLYSTHPSAFERMTKLEESSEELFDRYGGQPFRPLQFRIDSGVGQ